MNDETVMIKTIISDDNVLGHVLSYETDGKPEVSYWIGQKHWGKGIATRAVFLFLNNEDKRRPMYARAAKDNLASFNVLQKNGFKNITEIKGYANARGKEILELLKMDKYIVGTWSIDRDCLWNIAGKRGI